MLDAIRSDTARVVDVEELPPAADGLTYRFEVSLTLDAGVDSAPSESDVREIAEGVLEAVDEIDDPEWEGPDELYIQIYGPERDTDAGACGTAHWLADGGFESLESRPYLFGSVDDPTGGE